MWVWAPDFFAEHTWRRRPAHRRPTCAADARLARGARQAPDRKSLALGESLAGLVDEASALDFGAAAGSPESLGESEDKKAVGDGPWGGGKDMGGGGGLSRGSERSAGRLVRSHADQNYVVSVAFPAARAGASYVMSDA